MFLLGYELLGDICDSNSDWSQSVLGWHVVNFKGTFCLDPKQPWFSSTSTIKTIQVDP